MKSSCPLCKSDKTKEYFQFKKSQQTFEYFECNECSLVFMNQDSLLEAPVERSRYEFHKNDKRTPGYEKFLRELISPITERVLKTSLGLDYGSGPYPMMAELFKEDGYQINVYDPYFANDKSVLEKQYDFITCCEVAEHFYDPNGEFKKLYHMLRNQGILGMSTGILYENIDFSKWYYKSDDTHVVFYTPKAIDWICKNFDLNLIYFENNVVLFQKG